MYHTFNSPSEIPCKNGKLRNKTLDAITRLSTRQLLKFFYKDYNSFKTSLNRYDTFSPLINFVA